MYFKCNIFNSYYIDKKIFFFFKKEQFSFYRNGDLAVVINKNNR